MCEADVTAEWELGLSGSAFLDLHLTAILHNCSDPARFAGAARGQNWHISFWAGSLGRMESVGGRGHS